MNSLELTAAADALLASVERAPDAPHYSEERFRRKLRDATARLGLVPLRSQVLGAFELGLAEWASIIADANLTETQSEVMAMRFSGQTFVEIGAERGITKQGAARIYSQGARRLAAAWHASPLRGMAAAYEEDVRRGFRTAGRSE